MNRLVYDINYVYYTINNNIDFFVCDLMQNIMTFAYDAYTLEVANKNRLH